MSRLLLCFFNGFPKLLVLPVPNNQQFPYLQRLVNWSEKEPQRRIFLIVNGAGISNLQYKDLQNQLAVRCNIEIVDINKVENKRDFILSTPKGRYSMSAILMFQYHEINPDDVINVKHFKFFLKNCPFGILIDAMRLLMLANVEKITRCTEAIYMDFDILPDSKNALGTVLKPRGFLMADGHTNNVDFAGYLENSIIAVSDQSIIDEIIRNVEEKFAVFANRHINLMSFIDFLNGGVVFGCMKDILHLKVLSEASGFSVSELTKLKNSEDYFQYLDLGSLHASKMELLYKLYQFQSNGGNVVTERQDNSWKENKNLYSEPARPLIINHCD